MEKGIDYTGVGTCAICHDGEGRVFLNLRSTKCRDEWEKWDNCGGSLEFGESPETCMRRELREEYGCQAIKCQFGGFVNAVRNLDGKKTHWVILVYLVQISAEEAKNNEPTKFLEAKWFDVKHLPENRHSYFDRDFEQVKKLWEDFYSSHSSTDRTAAS